MKVHQGVRQLILGVLLALAAPMLEAQAELVMKILVVNPSETEVREFDIRNPLPPEIKPEHVLDSDGLKVEYDSQVGTYIIMGSVTLKPKESVTKRVILEDVWLIGLDQVNRFQRETDEIVRKLADTTYEER